MKNIEKLGSKEKYGENIEMTIDLIRHAEKSSFEGGLTKKGIEDSKNFSEKLETDFPDSAGVKVYHSGVERAKETAELIKGRSAFTERQKESLTLVGKISKEQVEKITALVDKQNSDETEAVQILLDTEDNKLDAETVSSKELSRGIASQLLTLIDMTSRFKETSKVNIVLVSHSGVIEHFLVDILGKSRAHFLTEVGGPVAFLEGARIAVKRQDKENVKIQFTFRNYERELYKEDLEKIISG